MGFHGTWKGLPLDNTPNDGNTLLPKQPNNVKGFEITSIPKD